MHISATISRVTHLEKKTEMRKPIFFILFLAATKSQLVRYSPEMSVLPEIFGDDCDKQAKAISVILAVKECDPKWVLFDALEGSVMCDISSDGNQFDPKGLGQVNCIEILRKFSPEEVTQADLVMYCQVYVKLKCLGVMF